MRVYTVAVLSSLLVLLACLLSQPLVAQHGHPLVGTWSGDLTGADRPVRALLALNFNVDQTITGFMVANGTRLPLTNAALDPDTWGVTLVAEGQSRTGDPMRYELSGRIESLGSPTEREIAGRWRDGDNEGDFRVLMNH